MRTVLAIAALVLVTACGSGDGTTATDPGASGPTAVPAASGLVRTREVVTVIDTGTPELCLGAIEESWPPQCSGPPIAGWDWSDHEGMYQKSGTTRWGQFIVIGTWDGTTLTYRDAIPGATHGPVPAEPTNHPPPSVERAPDELRRIADEVGRELPGALGSAVVGRHVRVDVVYDDGSLQDHVDQQYGDGVVVVVPALVGGRPGGPR